MLGALLMAMLVVAFVLSVVDAVRIKKLEKRTSGIPENVVIRTASAPDGTSLYLQADDGTQFGVMSPSALGIFQIPPGSSVAPLLTTSDGHGRTFTLFNAAMNGNSQKMVGFVLNGDQNHGPALAVGTVAGQSDAIAVTSMDGTAMRVANAPFGSPVSVSAMQGQGSAPAPTPAPTPAPRPAPTPAPTPAPSSGPAAASSARLAAMMRRRA